MSKISFGFETDPGDAEGLAVLQNLVLALTGFTKAINQATEKVETFNKVVGPLTADDGEATLLVKDEPEKVYPDRTEGGKFPEPLLKETDEERAARIAENKSKLVGAKPTEVVEQKPAETPGATTSLKIEEVRAMLAQKVGNNRAACKAKLAELGAASVSVLEPAKYQEMFDFLSSLE